MTGRLRESTSKWRQVALTVTGLAILGTAGAAVGASFQESVGFPHERHQGLFPLCTGCHEGIAQGNPADYYPEPSACTQCHDGQQQQTVAWTPPADRVTNLKFEHLTHAMILGQEEDLAQYCAECHIRPGGERMAVESEIQFETCWQCHAGTDHQNDAECVTCHIPLAESGFSRATIESFVPPADHGDPVFLAEQHGLAAGENPQRCATCHTADRCVACHVDAGRPEIEAMAFAPEDMELPPAGARYPVPATHEDEGWLAEHGTQASRDACATCHTQNDCSACHVAPLLEAIETIPPLSQVVAPGVGVMPHAPESHESLFFLDVHTVLASAGDRSCATCHEEAFCISCHEGPSDGGYHPPGFVARHSATAFGREAECTNCHNNEAFCRECHAQSGLTSSGRLGAGYHAAGPFWLIRHGQAARQGLESCISCHEQNDCMQCHGVASAFKVSPHGPDFDAERAWARSARTCVACHLGNPLNGNGNEP
jgi:hypothetical protein